MYTRNITLRIDMIESPTSPLGVEPAFVTPIRIPIESPTSPFHSPDLGQPVRLLIVLRLRGELYPPLIKGEDPVS